MTAGQEEGTLVQVVSTLWRRRWLVVGVLVTTQALALALYLVIPKTYEATTSVLAPKEGAGGGFLGGLVGASLLQQQFSGLSLPSLTPNRDLLIGVVKSRTVAQAVAERFRLQERYRTMYLEDAIKKLQESTTVSLSREGVITVKVEDRDPQVAAEIANFYVEQLDKLVAKYGTGEAGRQRVFLTEQMARAKVDLDSAEEALRRFQERNRAIALQEQTKGAIEAAARVKGEIIAAEVQLQVMQNFATEANPEMVALRRRIREMKRQFAQMQYGDGRGAGAVVPERTRDFTVPFPKVPEVAIELARFTRDVKVQETLVTLLTQQVEQARIAEAKDIPVVQVLDRAVPAERPSRPRLGLNIAIASVVGLFFGVFLAVFSEYAPSNYRRTS